MDQIFVFGAGGHAKVVLDVMERQGLYKPAFIVDDDAGLKGRTFFGYRVLGGREDLRAAAKSELVAKCFVAIGDNFQRLSVAQWLEDHGYELISAVHPSVQLARGVSIGANSVVMAGCVINSDARIANSVIVNTGATVDHDCSIRDGVHIAPGCHLCGNVAIGPATFLGAGTVVSPGVTIGGNTIVGTGSVVIEDLPGHVVAVGHPARIVKSNVGETSLKGGSLV
ncbi:MAG: acetyltransferase [Desulfomonile tiedjei]|nr:acetyltransferase [Desulfomonile tiedjei]